MTNDRNSDEATEFGLGLGMIDEEVRAGREGMAGHQHLQEIYSRPKTFGGSHLGLPGAVRPPVEETPVPRLLPSEVESDRG